MRSAILARPKRTTSPKPAALNSPRKFPADFRDKILCGDALDVMRAMPAGSIDLVVTSPPYNLKNSTGNGMKDGRGGKWERAALKNGYSHHADCMPHQDYVAWQRECLTEMMRLIPEDGAIFYNHKWRVQNGLLQDRSDIVAGFPVRQIIIWKRKGGINFNPGYFLPTYEVIYLIAKPKFRLAHKAGGEGDVWEIMQETRNRHPAPFPVALNEALRAQQAKRLSVAYTRIADEVKTLLHNDLRRQDIFESPETVNFTFGENRISVNDESYFSASSRAILKSSFYLGFLAAATKTDFFRHPRFCMIDTLENMGVEAIRSQNFQLQILRVSKESPVEHQIIYATAMIEPQLENEAFTVGAFSTSDDKTIGIKL